MPSLQACLSVAHVEAWCDSLEKQICLSRPGLRCHQTALVFLAR